MKTIRQEDVSRHYLILRLIEKEHDKKFSKSILIEGEDFIMVEGLNLVYNEKF